MARKRIGEILVQAGVLDDAGLRSALNEQRRWGGHLGRILIDMRLVDEEVLVRALSAQLNFPIVDLERIEVVQDVLDLVSGEMAEENSVIPIRVEGKFLDVAMSNPTNLGIIDELRMRAQLNVRPYLVGPYMMQKALGRFYGRGGALNLVGGRDPAMNDATSSQVGMTVIDDSPAFDPSAKAAANAAVDSGVSIDPPPGVRESDAFVSVREIRVLQERISQLEALVSRDEDVLRKLLALLVEKGLASRDEILERIR